MIKSKVKNVIFPNLVSQIFLGQLDAVGVALEPVSLERQLILSKLFEKEE